MNYEEPDILTQLSQKLHNYDRVAIQQHMAIIEQLNTAENYQRKGQPLPQYTRSAIASRLAYLTRMQLVGDRLLAELKVAASELSTTAREL